MERVASANEEAVGAWSGVLFDRFSSFRHIIVTGLEPHGEEALRINPPRAGDRVLDIGCGFGDTTQRLAELVGAEGEAVGIDAADRFIEAAREEAREAGAGNVRFVVGDVEVTELEERFQYAFSRMGTMFFANPVAALRNVRRALVPGGRLCMVVWRRKIDNPWLHRAEQVVEEFVTEDEDSDELTCGPGPFSMANADTVSDILLGAGFAEATLRRSDFGFRMGRDLTEAVDYVMALGPAGEVLRLARDDAERLEPEIVAALRRALSEYERSDGVWGNMSSWIVTARVPDAGE
ncbi:MAG: class I SAM-dependent methyltransferase [Actinomycetota bacterium]